MTNEQLVILIKAGEDVAGNMLQLYEQVKRFIHAMAWKYRESGEMEDLEQEGYLALYPAIDGYDPGQGTKFLTYAEYYIRQRMTRYLQQNGSTLRIPVGQDEKVRKYKRFCNLFQMDHGRNPTDRETAAYLNMSLEQVEEVRRNACMLQVGSLDSPVTGLDGGECATAGDLVPSSEDLEADILDRLDHERLHSILWECVNGLEDKQAEVIRRRFQSTQTFREIGEQWGTGIGEVRKQEAKALRELRKHSNSSLLRPFLPEEHDLYGYLWRNTGVESFSRTWTSSTERAAMEMAEGQICRGNMERSRKGGGKIVPAQNKGGQDGTGKNEGSGTGIHKQE